MHDLVIRNRIAVDGRGGTPVLADVAIDDGRITAVGTVEAPGCEELEATGLMVTPGFAYVHTHYDGQVTWDPLLTPAIRLFFFVYLVPVGVAVPVGRAPSEQRDPSAGLHAQGGTGSGVGRVRRGRAPRRAGSSGAAMRRVEVRSAPPRLRRRTPEAPP